MKKFLQQISSGIESHLSRTFTGTSLIPYQGDLFFLEIHEHVYQMTNGFVQRTYLLFLLIMCLLFSFYTFTLYELL